MVATYSELLLLLHVLLVLELELLLVVQMLLLLLVLLRRDLLLLLLSLGFLHGCSIDIESIVHASRPVSEIRFCE